MKFMRTLGFLLALSGAAGFATSVQAAREADPAAKDLILKGDAKCTGCHDEADEPVPSMLELKPGVLSIGKTKHGTNADKRTPSCTNCHGESLDHNNYKGKATAEQELLKHFTSGKKVKLDDGTEEEHKVIDSKDQAELKNLAQWILAQ